MRNLALNFQNLDLKRKFLLISIQNNLHIFVIKFRTLNADKKNGDSIFNIFELPL